MSLSEDGPWPRRVWWYASPDELREFHKRQAMKASTQYLPCLPESLPAGVKLTEPTEIMIQAGMYPLNRFDVAGRDIVRGIWHSMEAARLGPTRGKI